MNSHILVPELPPLPDGYLERSHLHGRLDESVERAPVTAVVAPAASGKTTLLVGWAAARHPRPVAYLALDVLDDDPVWFWSRVMTALRGFDTGIGAVAGSYVSTEADRRRFVTRLEADLATLDPMVLVLDRLNQVTSAHVVEVLGALLVNLPRSLRVVVASRAELPFHTGLLRARGLLTSIPPAELAFDPAELDDYLRQVGGVRLRRTDVESLHERTGGWVGGVKLAVSALETGQDRDTLLRSLGVSSHYVADLLQQEVLDIQAPDMRVFLLETSVLDTLYPDLCDVVTGRKDSAAVLEQAERSGLFLERHGETGDEVRYQPVFHDFLRHQLHLVDPDGERAAQRAAARWLERHDDIDQAIRYLLAAGDNIAAVELVLDHGERYAASGRLQLVRNWLLALPGVALVDDLALMMNVGRLCVIAGLRDEAEVWLERARWRLAGAHAPLMEGLLAMLLGHARIQVGDPEGAIVEGRRALAILEPLDQPAPWVMDWVHHVLAAAHTCLDEFGTARRHRAATSGAEEHAVLRAAYSALLSYRQGHLDRALEHSEVARRSDAPWLWGLALSARGAVERERNQTPEAEADLAAALELSEAWSRPFAVSTSATELASIRMAQGRPAEAHQLLTRARAVLEGPALRRRVDVTEATLWLAVGDVDRSLRIRQGLPPGHDTAALDVRLALAQGHLDHALGRVRDFWAKARSQQERIVALMLEARALVTVDEQGALACLKRAVDLGRRERFVRIYAHDLPEVHHLMRRLAADQEDPYLFGLLAAIADAPRSTRLSSVLVDALSTRESIVLRYLPTSLSNKEIAAELHMSVNTLKTHLKNINRKLGAGSRAEAVAAARSLDLI